MINLLAFTLFGADKYRARNRRWRIPEKTLLGAAILGGSLGAVLGMCVFRHKTKHWYFRLGLPLLLVLQAAAGWMAWKYWLKL